MEQLKKKVRIVPMTNEYLKMCIRDSQCGLRRAGLTQRKVSRRLLHRHSPQRRFVRLGFDELLFFEFVLQ